MAIEFRCTQCNKLLRTGDETVGKQARCPECGAITVVPQPDSIPESASEPSQDSGPFSDTLPGSTPPPSPTPHEAGSPFGGDSPFASGAVPPPGGTSDTDNPYQSPSDFGE